MFYRYLYWIDCCEYPHIGRVGMDGSSQTVVIETQISRPMALTIDYVNHRLYWADENHIEFSDMDGSHRHKGWSTAFTFFNLLFSFLVVFKLKVLCMLFVIM